MSKPKFHNSAIDIIGQPSMNPVFNVIPQYLNEMKKNYREYLVPLPDRVKSLEQQIEKMHTENAQLRNELEKHTQITNKIDIDDSSAEDLIVNYLRKQKENGKNQINILTLMNELCLPVGQVDRILDKLEQEGIVSDSE
jgi:predicted RNase H-like nuclease (RuvC/YqgF family)